MTWFPNLANVLMPVQGTKLAGDVDALYIFLLIVSFVSFVIMMGGMVFFMIKYRRTSLDQKSAYISHNNVAEFLWSFIPFVLLMITFYWGYVIFVDLRTAPENVAEEIHVTARQWMWNYEYKNGKSFSSTEKDAVMIVPVGKPVKLVLTSKDVIHSFWIPAFRVKQDAVPGKYSQIWFEASQSGDYAVNCTEYCGTKHSQMPLLIRAVDPKEYSAWYYKNEDEGASLAQKGAKLFNQKACAGCHSIDGSKVVGPTMKGLAGAERKFVDGTKAVADDAYLRESILNSMAKIVEGYPPAMPLFQGQLEEEEVSAIIDYIKSVK